MSECECPDKALTRRTIQSGLNSWTAYQWQCPECGSSSQMIKQATLTKEQMGRAVPFDETLRDRYWEQRRREWQEQRADREAVRASEQEGRRAFYYDHINSDKWRAIAGKALKRDKYICQGCLERAATEAHHLTYERLGDELVCDVISLCRHCHMRIEGIEINKETPFLMRAH